MAKNKGTSSIQELQNAAKTLYTNVLFSSVDRPIKSLVLTSTIPNEGKSTVAMYLAEAAATADKRVLLVECDMRRRSLANMLNVRAKHGSYSVMSRQVELTKAAVATNISNLFFLDAEPHVPNPADLLQSRAFTELMTEAEREYDLVIFDTPPVGTFVDAAVVAAKADAAMLVVRENFTKRAEVVNAFEQLQKADANVIGVVMNYCESRGSEYYYAYYSKDGKRASKEEVEASRMPENASVPAGSAGGISSTGVALPKNAPRSASSHQPSSSRSGGRAGANHASKRPGGTWHQSVSGSTRMNKGQTYPKRNGQ